MVSRGETSKAEALAKKVTGSRAVAFDLIEQADKAKPFLQIVPDADAIRSIEISRMFAELEGFEEHAQELRSFSALRGGNAPWCDASYYELEDRTHHLAEKSKSGVLSTDFTWEKWRQLLAAFEWSCGYCGANHELGQDHVVAIRRGGHDVMRNILPACQSCCIAKDKYDSPVDTWLKSRGKRFHDAAKQRIEQGLRRFRKK